MEWLKVKELRGELRSAHAENARLRQQVEMATVLEKIAPQSEIGALLSDASAAVREAIAHIYSQAQHIESLQNKFSQATAEVERLTLEGDRLRRSEAMIVEQSARLREELAQARGYDTWADMRRAELMEQSE